MRPLFYARVVSQVGVFSDRVILRKCNCVFYASRDLRARESWTIVLDKTRRSLRSLFKSCAPILALLLARVIHTLLGGLGFHKSIMMHPFVVTTAGFYVMYEISALYEISTTGDGISSSYPLSYWVEEIVSRTPVCLLLAAAKAGDALIEVMRLAQQIIRRCRIEHGLRMGPPCLLIFIFDSFLFF